MTQSKEALRCVHEMQLPANRHAVQMPALPVSYTLLPTCLHMLTAQTCEGHALYAYKLALKI